MSYRNHAKLQCFVVPHTDRAPTLECQLHVRTPGGSPENYQFIKTYRRSTLHHNPYTLIGLIAEDVAKKYDLIRIELK